MSSSPSPTTPTIQPASSTLGRATASGILWLLMQSLSGRVGSFVSQLVLAKLLLPEGFGAVGLAYTVATLANAFVSFGIDDILLQRSRAMYLWVSPAFWTSLGGGLIGGALMLGAAPFAARSYGAPILIGLLALLAINLPIIALATVPTVKLRGALNYQFLGVYATIETLALQLVTVILAVLGFGAYSFIVPLPIAAAIKLWVFWRKAPTRIVLRFRRVQFLHIINSSFLVQGGRILTAAVNQGDYIVLGLLANDATVGIYYFAFRLAAQPLQMLAGNFSSVIFPVLTQLRADPVRQERTAIRASRVLSYIVTPVCFLQAALAGPVLHLMFGTKWNAAIPLMQVLSLGLPGDATAWISGALLVARREFKRDFVYLLMFTTPFFILVTAGAMLASSLGVASAVSLYYAIVKPMNSWLIFRSNMQLSDFLQTYIFPPIIAGAAMGTAYACAEAAVFEDHSAAQIGVTLVVGPIIYLGMLRLFAPETLREVLERFPVSAVSKRLRRR